MPTDAEKRMFAGDGLLVAACLELAKVVEEMSDHERLVVKTQWDAVSDRWALRVRCPECKKERTHYWAGIALAKVGPAPLALANWFRDEVVPEFRGFAKTDCYALSHEQLAAEWLTEELAKAGADGVRYYVLLSRASAERLCNPVVVDGQLRKLGILGEDVPVSAVAIPASVLADMKSLGPVMRLPAGHPMNDWEVEADAGVDGGTTGGDGGDDG